jgi:hypothetical protein
VTGEIDAARGPRSAVRDSEISNQGVAEGPAAARSFTPGLILAAAVLAVYGGLAVSIDFPRTANGIHSDEATYYMMGHSLAEDGDLTYRKEDLIRVWHEFSSGPSGVFLKKGTDILDAGLMRRPPFVWLRTQNDPDPSRLFYGKSFAYPLAAAPFVKVFGTNGFLVLHALLMSLCVWCGFLFLHARMPSSTAAILAGAFVLVSIVPVYFVWIEPDLFNFALGLLGYFCWLYKAVVPPAHLTRRMAWLMTGKSDLVAAVLLGIATFSKPWSALLFPPIVLWLLYQRRLGRAVATSMLFLAVTVGLFAVNMAISGDWNYQGGGENRRTFYWEFPFQTEKAVFEVGLTKARDEALGHIIFNQSVFWKNLTHNFYWFFVGRFAGLVPYFFPAVFALFAFLTAPRRRPLWQYFVLAAALGQILTFIIAVPYTWNGGGGSVGNRYFMGAYGAFLFLMPPISRPLVAMVPWAVGALFTAPLILNPFVTSSQPGNHTKSGPFRWLPPELTLVYDWPINNQLDRVRIWFGDNPPDRRDPGFQIYFFDDNAYREPDKSFWVRGESEAEFLVKTDRPMKTLVLTMSAGPEPVNSVARLGRQTHRVSLQPGEARQLTFDLPENFWYQGQWPVWVASISTDRGFVPLFHEPSTDTRFLGVRVKPILIE